MLFVIKYWKLIAGGISALALVLGFWWHGVQKYNEGAKDERTFWENKLEAIRKEQVHETEKALKEADKTVTRIEKDEVVRDKETREFNERTDKNKSLDGLVIPRDALRGL